jgi:hypothetical protein
MTPHLAPAWPPLNVTSGDCDTTYAYYMHYIFILSSWLHTVTSVPIARQRLCKHIPARANACENRTSIAGQRISKQAFLTIEAVFSAWSVRSGYIKTDLIEQHKTVV